MESFPKLGMRFEQVRSRLLKYDSVMTNPNMADSLLTQARVCEGDSAANELSKEFISARIDTNNHSSNRIGSSPLYAGNYDKIKWS